MSTFVAAAETLSFTEAGRRFGVSASAIGKSIARLESRFGVRLFHRSTRSMKLTAEGELLLQRCHRILSELKAAEHELSTTLVMPRGKLRVSVPLIGNLLLPRIARFIEFYPNVEVEIDVTDRKVDLIDEGYDAAIRIGDTIDTRIMSRSLGCFRQILVASPSYVERCGQPATAQDLLSHTLLLYRFPNTGKFEQWPVADFQNVIGSTNVSNVVCNSVEILKYLTLEGRGIACLPDFEVAQALRSKRLVDLPQEAAAAPRTLTVLWPSSKHLSPKVRAFIDILSEDSCLPEA
ncbi:LysR family transcriptional regulator [Sphingomonas parapaucimobilis]|uniref:LysR family transcriptional regulator n=1 Tax=Sphingomonas parapaucimobilis TaxID=28213 RepID=UPI0024815A6A|nr:LysR family transcriptional regulator [Sphingomonas parapaucimobilis]